jgi:hypothetical protein
MLKVGVIMSVLLLAIGFALTPLVSIGNTLGPPDQNIEEGNCNCHYNEAGVAESDPSVLITTQDLPDRMVVGSESMFTVAIQNTDNSVDPKDKFGFAVDIDSLDKKELDGAMLRSAHGKASEKDTHLGQDGLMDEGVFNVTLTAPTEAQWIKVTVMGMISDDNNNQYGDRWNTISKDIKILKPREIELNTTVENNGAVEAKEITVSFYVEEDLIGNQTIDILEPGAESNVSVMWNATFMPAGEYEVRIFVDGENINPELDEDNNELTQIIVIKEEEKKEPLDTETMIYILIGIFAFIIIAGIIYRRMR